MASTRTGSEPACSAIWAMSEKTHSSRSGVFLGVNEFDRSWSLSMPTTCTLPSVCTAERRQRSARAKQSEAVAHLSLGTSPAVLLLPLDEASVNEDLVLALTAVERCDDLEAELAVADARAEEDLMLVVERALDVDLAVRKLGNRFKAVGDVSERPMVGGGRLTRCARGGRWGPG